jgi:hypothetical protein
MASTDDTNLQTIVEQYNKILDKTEKMIVDKQLEKEAKLAKEFYEQQACDAKERVGTLKDNIRSKLGKPKFEELYALLRKLRSNPHCQED